MQASAQLVVPGASHASALPIRMRSHDPRVQMPPLGTAIPDFEALALIERWIDHADAACAPSADRLYREGDRDRNIQPCAACHGSGGRGRETNEDPMLRGQHAVYTTRQLTAYAARTRYRGSRSLAEDAPGADAMQAAVEKLTREEIGALSACLQRLL